MVKKTNYTLTHDANAYVSAVIRLPVHGVMLGVDCAHAIKVWKIMIDHRQVTAVPGTINMRVCVYV